MDIKTTQKTPAATKAYWFTMFALVLLALLGMWVSTGTLSPYAITLDAPKVTGAGASCAFNIDHSHWMGPFQLLFGDPAAIWSESVVLRRILYALLVLPLTHWFPVEIAGFITNVLLQLMAMLCFCGFIRRNYGEKPALLVGGLLATYPGVSYWIGHPYAYALIVPSSLLSFILLDWLARDYSFKRASITALLIGIMSTGYDLLPSFGCALLLQLIFKRAWKLCLPCLFLLVLPTLTVLLYLYHWHSIPLSNSNSDIYGVLIKAYFTTTDYGKWIGLVAQAPLILIQVFTFSNFLFLPLLAVVMIGLTFKKVSLKSIQSHPEISVFLSALLFFLFLNLAPPYDSRWQMRGVWIARLYQPLLVVLLSVCARCLFTLETNRSKYQELKKNPWSLALGCFAVTILAQALVVFGPILGITKPAAYLYHQFYQHGKAEHFDTNIAKLGRLPLGFCSL
jgi:hypothetical protein